MLLVIFACLSTSAIMGWLTSTIKIYSTWWWFSLWVSVILGCIGIGLAVYSSKVSSPPSSPPSSPLSLPFSLPPSSPSSLPDLVDNYVAEIQQREKEEIEMKLDQAIHNLQTWTDETPDYKDFDWKSEEVFQKFSDVFIEVYSLICELRGARLPESLVDKRKLLNSLLTKLNKVYTAYNVYSVSEKSEKINVQKQRAWHRLSPVYRCEK